MSKLLENGTKVRFLRDVRNMSGDRAYKGDVGVIEHGNSAEALNEVCPWREHENGYFIKVDQSICIVIAGESDIEKIGEADPQ